MLRVRRELAAALCAIVSSLGSACSTPLTERECEALLVRYTDRLLVSNGSDTSAEERSRLKAEVHDLAAEDPAFRRCSDEVSRSAFDCAMSAPSVDEIERCLL